MYMYNYMLYIRVHVHVCLQEEENIEKLLRVAKPTEMPSIQTRWILLCIKDSEICKTKQHKLNPKPSLVPTLPSACACNYASVAEVITHNN